MALDIDSSSLASGDSVTVTADDTSYDGEVESVSDGTAKILVTDNGIDIDEECTVTDEGGNLLGSAAAYVNSPLTVVAYAGTVSSVSVDEGDKVSEGDTLLKLTDTGYTANLDSLLEERSDLEDELDDLIKIYRDGSITAQMSGTVKAVPEDDDSSSSASDSTGFFNFNFFIVIRLF